MRLGISTACFYPRVTEVTVREMLSLGYKNLEVFVNSEEEYSENYIKELRRMTDAEGVRIGSLHPYTSGMEPFLLFSEYDRRRSEVVSYYRRCIAAAAEYGAKIFVLHGASDHSGAERGPSELELDVYGKLCDAGDEFGVTIAQENVKLFLSRIPAYLAALRSAEPRLGYNFDVKQARRAKRSDKDYLDAMGNRLVNVHINDTDSGGKCRLPGSGDVDLRSLVADLRARGYDGALVTEVYREDFVDTECVVKSKKYMEEIVNNI